MIRKFDTYIKEELTFETTDDIKTINGKDYLETWECTTKNRYRNLKTGELKFLADIFKISSIFLWEGYIGVFDREDKFKILNVENQMFIEETDYNLRFNEVKLKGAPSYIEIVMGPDIIHWKIGGKKRAGVRSIIPMKNPNRFQIPKLRFTICRFYEYCEDFRLNFRGRYVRLKDIWGKEQVFRVPDRYSGDETSHLVMTPGYRGKLTLRYIDYSKNENKFFEIDIFQEIRSLEKIINDPSIDPYGEEDWGDSYWFSNEKTNEGLLDLLKKRKKRRPRVGSRVVYVWDGGEDDSAMGRRQDLDGKHGRVLDNSGRMIGVEFDDYINGHSCSGNGKNGYCYYVMLEYLIKEDPKDEERIRKKKEELRLKHQHIDPYGEEDWMNESVEEENIIIPLKFRKTYEYIDDDKMDELYIELNDNPNQKKYERTFQENIPYKEHLESLLRGKKVKFTSYRGQIHTGVFRCFIYNVYGLLILRYFDGREDQDCVDERLPIKILGEVKRVYSQEDPYGEEEWD